MHRKATIIRPGLIAGGLALLTAGAIAGAWLPWAAPAVGETTALNLPAPPADGVMGFVVDEFIPPVIQEPGACPEGTALKVRDAWLAKQSPEERARLSRKENEKELTKLWQADIFGPNGTNVCSQPDMFDRPLLRTVQSRNAWGLDLDKGANSDGCAHDEFTDPHGNGGIDNQQYRAMGCTLEWRGTDGIKGDQAVGMRQFHASGEWTQVILLRGVDSLENDPEVEVIYGNTPDRPLADSKGTFLRGASFTVSEAPPRHRNVLKGRIENGILTTEPQDIKLTQTWGQGGARDIRGNRTTYDYRRGQLKLAFQIDGSLRGLVGGYQPLWDVFQSASLGSFGSPLVAGIDCAAILKTLKANADGDRDPQTGQCTTISSAMQMHAIPAFVNDARTAGKETAK